MSVKCLENARALAGPFCKVAFIVSIGGCGFHNLKVVIVCVGEISRRTSYMVSAEQTTHSLEVHLLMPSFSYPNSHLVMHRVSPKRSTFEELFLLLGHTLGCALRPLKYCKRWGRPIT